MTEHIHGESAYHISPEVKEDLKGKPLSALLRIALRDQGTAYGPAALDILAEKLDELERTAKSAKSLANTADRRHSLGL
jgi:hypothetical protein